MSEPKHIRSLFARIMNSEPFCAVAVKAAGVCLSFCAQTCMVLILDTAQFGRYAYTLNWAMFAVLIAQSGFSTSVVRHICALNAKGSCDVAANVSTFLLNVVAAIGLSLAIALLITSASSNLFNQKLFGHYYLIFAAIPFLSITYMCAAILRAYRRHVVSVAIAHSQPAMLFLSAALLMMILGDRRIAAPLLSHLILASAIIATGFAALQVRKVISPYRTAALMTFAPQQMEWLSCGAGMLATTIFVYLQGKAGVLMAGATLNDAEIGEFATAERLCDAALLGTVFVHMLFSPRFASAAAVGDYKRVRIDGIRSANYGTLFFLAVATFLLVFGLPMLVILGDGYEKAYMPLLPLLLGAGVCSACGAPGIILQMTGHNILAGVIAFISTLIAIPLVHIAGQCWGATGVAAGVALCRVFFYGALLVAVRRQLGVWVHARLSRPCTAALEDTVPG